MYREDTYAAILFIAFALLFSLEALNYPIGSSLRKVGPGFFPLVCLGLLAAFSAVLLGTSLRHRSKMGRVPWPRSFVPLLIVMAAVFAYGFILLWLGFLITTFLFAFVLFWQGYPRHWVLTTVGAAVTSILSVLVFEVWLKIQFPKGLIGV